MLDLIIARLQNPQFLFALLVGLAAAATAVTVALPLLEADSLRKRMRAVGAERERIRARERERLAKGNPRANLRYEPKAYMKNIVDQFKLGDWLGTEGAKQTLAMAGYRGPQAEIAFLFFRMVSPILFFAATAIYVFFINDLGQPVQMRVLFAVIGAYVGIKAPELYLKNTIQKRQQSMKRAWPDAMDLMLICVESGMSIEQAFRRVSQEVGTQSVALAEELTLTTAELSYLPDRRQAFENLGARTGLEAIRSVVTALIQAERYGTPIGTALRVLSQESRDQRMNEAEKKAAALPPKLTVPMILFFLPVLFVVILMPAVIEVYGWK